MASDGSSNSALDRLRARRAFIRTASAGTTMMVLGSLHRFAPDWVERAARAEDRPDGRPRVPPGQRVLQRLKPMGGEPGDPSKSKYRLRIHGQVRKELTVDFRELLALPQSEVRSDVHCVTGWSRLDAKWKGVTVARLAREVGLAEGVNHVIFEGAHGYTANAPLTEALAPDVMVAHRLDGKPLAHPHGAPVRAVVPDLYFWKSTKWLTGIKFVARDEPGYWEKRGYNNHGDPWKEERYS